MSAFTLDQIRVLVGGRVGIHDVACPVCGPSRHDPRNQVRKVLRIWHEQPEFASFKCARCELSGSCGYVSGNHRALQSLKPKVAAFDARHVAMQRAKARKLARLMQPASGTVVERYLRDARGYDGIIPETLGFLPSWGDIPPRMIGLFGVPEEVEPGKLHLSVDHVKGIHLTRLKPDGSGKAADSAKFMIGRSKGHPLVLAPMNDSLGLFICEGIETGLSWSIATGLGVWVAGSANRMPALANAVPEYVDCVCIDNEGNSAGIMATRQLAAKLEERGLHAEICHPKVKKAA